MNNAEITVLPGRDRSVVAVSPISASQLILKQQPYAWVLQDDQLAARCDHCARLCERPLRCSRCKAARYCSADHQRAAWGGGHKEECAALVACAPRAPPPTVRLLARLLWRREREQQQGSSARGPEGGGRWADVEGLVAHWDGLDGGRKVAFAQMAALTREYMAGAGAAGPPADVRASAQLLARLAANAHTLCDEELRPYGVGLYPLGAMVNHGEPPSAVQGFSGTAIEFRAVRPIAAGEEVTISYVELASPRLERRQQLLHHYRFDLDSNGADDSCGGGGGAAEGGAGPSGVAGSEEGGGGGGGGSGSGAKGGAGYSGADVRLWGARPEWSQEMELAAPSGGDGGSGGSSGSGGGGGGGAWLHGFGPRPRPPWREDAPDAGMCELLLPPPQGAAPGGGGSGGGGGGGAVVALPGGMMLIPAESGGGGGGGALGPASESFPVGMADEEGGAAGPRLEAAAEAALAAVMGAGARGMAAAEGAQSQVLQWGDWGPAAAAAGGAAAGAPALAAAAARVLLAAARALSEAERLTRGGAAAAAADLLAAALQSAGCPPPGVPGPRRPQLEPPAAPGGGAAPPALGPRHALRQRLLAALLNACVSAGDRWPAALAAAEALVPCYEAAYPPAWPNLGLHIALVSKLRMLLEDPAGARAAAERAAEILKVCAPASPVLDEVLRLRRDAECELAAAAGGGRRPEGDDE
ncbi:MAG: hypothetical protein J3K34DRAFT_509635 [Monoraphidium minutum]|nr:MAG: hypothetical protein J3K34DRAFT_509635 [Monoraphidium minutum]